MTLTRRVSTLCSAGDEGPAALAIVQASPMDCGLYRCTIQNEHGSASTDFRLSPEGECLVGGVSDYRSYFVGGCTVMCRGGALPGQTT